MQTKYLLVQEAETVPTRIIVEWDGSAGTEIAKAVLDDRGVSLEKGTGLRPGTARFLADLAEYLRGES